MSRLGHIRVGPMRATRTPVKKLQDGNEIASDRAIRNDWGCRCPITVVCLRSSIFLPWEGNPNGPSTVVFPVGVLSRALVVSEVPISGGIFMYDFDEQKASLRRFRKAALLAVVIPAALLAAGCASNPPPPPPQPMAAAPPPPPPPPMPPVRG